MADTNLLVLAREFSKLRSDVKEVLKMPVGPQGERGERGEKGDPGKPGKDGRDGINGRDGVGVPGRDGRDGVDGVDGKDGKDGVSVTNAYVDFDGSLVIELSDGNQIDAGFINVEARENVVQQLKNGALSLNELLPSQAGNVGKVLATDGTNTYWTTVSSGGGGAVDSVNGQTGVVVLDAADVGAATTAQGALADSAVQPGDLATVATTGAYSDLTGKPTLGTAAAQDTSYFATAAQGTKADSALQPADIGVSVQAYDADLTTWASKNAPTGTVVGTSDTQTLTNKRITIRSSTTASSATPTINTDDVDIYGLTAQAVDITSFTTNLSGTPTDGQKLWIYIVGTGARAITWGSSFESSTATLPTTTVSTNRLDVGFVWNAATSKWRCVAVA